MRTNRRSALVLTAALFALASCGGGSSDGSQSDDGETSADSGSTFDGALAEVVSALEAIEYTCQPETFVMTSAERAICNTFSSIGVSAYAWADADTLDAEFDMEVFCTSDSALGEIRYLRGDTWAASAYSLSESTETKSTEIDAVLASLQTALGGTLDSKPCG